MKPLFVVLQENNSNLRFLTCNPLCNELFHQGGRIFDKFGLVLVLVKLDVHSLHRNIHETIS